MIRSVLVPFAVTRAVLFSVAALALLTLPVLDRCRECEIASAPWLNAFLRWDGTAYLGIARDGYRALADLAFFPLYPVLIRIGGTLLGGSVDGFAVAAIVIANACAVAGLWYVARVARAYGPNVATPSVLALLAFPTSFFLSAVYGESLLLLGLAGCVLHAREAQWKRAALFGAIAALSRPFGVLAVVPLVIEARRHGRPALVAALAPIAAAAAWLVAIGGPGVYLAAQSGYGRRPALAAGAFADLFDPSVYGDPWIVIATTLLVGALTVAAWRVLAAPLSALATAYFAAAISTGTLTSAPRYYVISFPIFICLALVAGRVTRTVYVVAGTTLGALLVAMFVLWYWVA